MNKNINAAGLPCEVVQDLLPLYHEGLVSEKTAKAVDVHLEGCADCRREYELIRTELPCGSSKTSTGERFARMMKRLRLRRMLAILLTAILTCAVLAGGFWGLTQVPARHLDESNISIERAYVYTEGGETRLFILSMVPAWNNPTFHKMYLEETGEPGVWALKCEFKVPVVSGRFREIGAWESIWDIPVNTAIENVKAVTYAGEVIWEAENAGAVPGYVRAHRDYMDFHKEFNGMTVDVDKNLIGFDNAQEKRFIYWDLDGNLLYEGDGTDADKVIDFDVPDDPPVIDE